MCQTDEQRDFEFPADFIGPVIQVREPATRRTQHAECAHGVPTYLACVYCAARTA